MAVDLISNKMASYYRRPICTRTVNISAALSRCAPCCNGWRKVAHYTLQSSPNS